jgi:hypothetical protein
MVKLGGRRVGSAQEKGAIHDHIQLSLVTGSSSQQVQAIYTTIAEKKTKPPNVVHCWTIMIFVVKDAKYE